MNKFITLYTSLLILFIAVHNCTIPNSDYPPRLKTNSDSLYHQINSIIKCEKTEINGIKLQLNDTLILDFNARIINASNLPKDTNELKNIQRKIASNLKNQLIDSNQFTGYNIVFIEQRNSQNSHYENAIFAHSFSTIELSK